MSLYIKLVKVEKDIRSMGTAETKKLQDNIFAPFSNGCPQKVILAGSLLRKFWTDILETVVSMTNNSPP